MLRGNNYSWLASVFKHCQDKNGETIVLKYLNTAIIPALRASHTEDKIQMLRIRETCVSVPAKSWSLLGLNNILPWKSLPWISFNSQCPASALLCVTLPVPLTSLIPWPWALLSPCRHHPPSKQAAGCGRAEDFWGLTTSRILVDNYLALWSRCCMPDPNQSSGLHSISGGGTEGHCC